MHRWCARGILPERVKGDVRTAPIESENRVRLAKAANAS